MKVVILAGGLGSRLAEETELRPKPMTEIGERPILWHIMKHYSHFQLKEFYVALGYKGDQIKRYFLDYCRVNMSVTVDLRTGAVSGKDALGEDWLVHLVDTGALTNTGGRLKRLEPDVRNSGTFMLTYGDGVSDVNLNSLLDFHRSHGRLATVLAVRPPARFGGLLFDGNLVSEFTEKPQIGEGWINGGFMVLEPDVFDYLKNDDTSLEADALENLALDRELAAYRHDGFWQCLDTLRDLRLLRGLWDRQEAPWRVW